MVKQLQRAVIGREIWDGRCAGALQRLLRAQGDTRWPLDALLECVRHRFASDVNHAFHPATWLPRLTDYASGPLDRYGKPVRLDRRACEAAVGVHRAAVPAKPARNFDRDLAALQAETLDLGGLVPDATAWRRALTHIKLDVNPHSLDTWLKPLRILALTPDGKTIFRAPAIEWDGVREQFGTAIEKALRFEGVLSGQFEIWLWDENADGNPWVPI